MMINFDLTILDRPGIAAAASEQQGDTWRCAGRRDAGGRGRLVRAGRGERRRTGRRKDRGKGKLWWFLIFFDCKSVQKPMQLLDS